MKSSIAAIIALLLSANALAEAPPTGGKACEKFNSFYGDSLVGSFAKSIDSKSTDAELASKLAENGLEANEIKYIISVRSNCLSHIAAMEKQYEDKSDNQERITQNNPVASDASLIDSTSDSNKEATTDEGWKSISNWRKLEAGMGYDDVRSILGEPHKIDGGNVAQWYYQNDGEVTFVANKLHNWREPRQ